MRTLTALLTLGIVVVGCMGVPAARAASGPSAKAAARAELLTAGVKSLRLDVLHYGVSDKSLYSLTLTVPWFSRTIEPPFHPLVIIDAEAARKIIGYLAESGALDKAQEGELINSDRAPTTAWYVLNVQVTRKYGPKLVYQESLGWGLPMLNRLEGLRKVLEGDAAKAMDRLLSRLSGYRRQWEQGSASGSTSPGKSAGVTQSPTGWELYVWQQTGTAHFSLLPGSRRIKTDDEIARPAVRGIEAIQPRLDQLKAGETIVILGRRAPGRPPRDDARAVSEYCRKIGLKVLRP